jgi:hypothetical protein
MAYVVQEDIIASIDLTFNLKQGESQIYEITLDRDFIGNQLNARAVTSISVGILNSSGKKVLMYNNPMVPGVSDTLIFADVSENKPGVIRFEITASQSLSITGGQLNAQVTLVFSDFYPNAKTYIMPLLLLGQVIEADPIDGGGGTTTPSTGLGAPLYTIEHIDGNYPSQYGKMSINSQDPTLITEITFRNLDKNAVRATILENFLVNRMGADQIDGIITLFDTNNSKFYTLYKIIGWQRVDITTGNGNTDNTDGIKIRVVLEGISTGPGVLKTRWNMGDNVTFSIDTHGITKSSIKPTGILTFADKNKKVTIATNGNNSPTGAHISYSPYYDSYVIVEINGISIDLGNNSKNATAYFSGNNGLTAVQIESIREGDQLIWNGDIAGYELELGDEINLIYEVNVDDLR